MSPLEVKNQATEFLSCFYHRQVRWDVDVTAVPFDHGRAIHGLTGNARDPSIQYRFLRFRFPFVRFEWNIESPYHTVNTLLTRNIVNESVLVRFSWKAWTKNYAASALIAAPWEAKTGQRRAETPISKFRHQSFPHPFSGVSGTGKIPTS